MSEPALRSRDHLAAFVAWVVAASAALASATAATWGHHGHIPWDATLFPVMFGVPGAIIASRAPRGWIGWLMLFLAACFASTAVGTQWLEAGSASGSQWWAWWVGRGGAASLVPATLLLILLLPDGRLPTPRWRNVVGATVFGQLALISIASFTRGPAVLDESVRGAKGLVNPVGVLPESWNSVIDAVADPVLTLPFLLGIPVVVVRLRAATAYERPRIVGVLAAVALFVSLVTVPDLAWPGGAVWFHIAGVALLASAILVAVLRGDFEPVEVAVSRTLVFGFLSVIVAAVYATLVSLAPRIGLPERYAGSATAVVALALLPARALVQSALRRLVYGTDTAPSVTLGESELQPVMPELSKRENEIMRLVARGLTNAQIAAELFISPITVRNHVSSILAKLHVTNRTQAVVKYHSDPPPTQGGVDG